MIEDVIYRRDDREFVTFATCAKTHAKMVCASINNDVSMRRYGLWYLHDIVRDIRSMRKCTPKWCARRYMHERVHDIEMIEFVDSK